MLIPLNWISHSVQRQAAVAKYLCDIGLYKLCLVILLQDNRIWNPTESEWQKDATSHVMAH